MKPTFQIPDASAIGIGLYRVLLQIRQILSGGQTIADLAGALVTLDVLHGVELPFDNPLGVTPIGMLPLKGNVLGGAVVRVSDWALNDKRTDGRLGATFTYSSDPGQNVTQRAWLVVA